MALSGTKKQTNGLEPAPPLHVRRYGTPVHRLVLQMDLLLILHDVEVVEGRRAVGEAHHLLRKRIGPRKE